MAGLFAFDLCYGQFYQKMKAQNPKLVSWVAVWAVIALVVVFKLVLDFRQTRQDKLKYKALYLAKSREADSLRLAQPTLHTFGTATEPKNAGL